MSPGPCQHRTDARPLPLGKGAAPRAMGVCHVCPGVFRCVPVSWCASARCIRVFWSMSTACVFRYSSVLTRSVRRSSVLARCVQCSSVLARCVFGCIPAPCVFRCSTDVSLGLFWLPVYWCFLCARICGDVVICHLISGQSFPISRVRQRRPSAGV